MFEHDQGVDAFEVDGVDVQKVDGDNVLGLGSEELPPGRSGTTWGGVDAGLVEDVPHGGGGHLVAEAGEFAMDAPVAPSRVLGCHAQDQGFDGGGRWRASGSAPLAVVPLLRDQFAVPNQQRGWGHREDLGPAAARYEVRERSEPQAVGWFVAYARDLTAQDRVLVAQHQQLRVPGDVTPQQHRGQRQQATGDGVHRGQDHEA